jgi:peptide-methionine (S)-S-oxide reductase
MNNGFQTGYKRDKIVTQIERAPDAFAFYAADDDHQRYLENNPYGYCNHFIRFPVWPTPQAK